MASKMLNGNKDLLNQAKNLREGREIKMCKVESHLDENPDRARGVSIEDIIVNVAADIFAEQNMSSLKMETEK